MHYGWHRVSHIQAETNLKGFVSVGLSSTPSNDTMLASVSSLYPQSLEVFLASPSSKPCCLLPASVCQLPQAGACCLLLLMSRGEETMFWSWCLLREATCCLLPVMSRREETMVWAWCLLKEATCCLLLITSRGEETMLSATSHVKGTRNIGLGQMYDTRVYLLSATSHVKGRRNNAQLVKRVNGFEKYKKWAKLDFCFSLLERKFCQNDGQCSEKVEGGLSGGWFLTWWIYRACWEKSSK